MRRMAVVALLAAAGCRGEPPPPAPMPPAVATTGEVTPLDAPGLHNLFRVSDRVYSGSSPDGDAGFASLQKLGVRTVVSVDGVTPDAAAARRHGIAYVHLPFGYDGVPRDRVVALVKAAAVLPGPVYVHCHHGKHRGPAAVAAMMMCADPAWDAGRAEAWLRTAGTDARYTGLVSLPRSLARPTAEELARGPSAFPAAEAVPDLARRMVEVDARWDHLKLARGAGWAAPKDHPDLDPPHEALQLAEHYREAARLPSVKGSGPAFVKLFGDAEAVALDLEWALRASPADATGAARAFARSAAACASCHDQYRDRPDGR